VEKRFEQVPTPEEMNARFDIVDNRLDRLERRVTNLETRPPRQARRPSIPQDDTGGAQDDTGAARDDTGAAQGDKVARAMRLTPLHAIAMLPSGVGIMLRTTPPPDGMGHVWNVCSCTSNRTSVLG